MVDDVQFRDVVIRFIKKYTLRGQAKPIQEASNEVIGHVIADIENRSNNAGGGGGRDGGGRGRGDEGAACRCVAGSCIVLCDLAKACQ